MSKYTIDCVLSGCKCLIKLNPEENGFNYEVYQVMRRETEVFFCFGWSCGTKNEAIIEAREHAESTLKRIQSENLTY